MKANLEFILPDEEEELNLALKVNRYKAALDDVSQYLRGLDKHDGHTQFKDTRDMAEKVREHFHDLTEGLDLV